MAIMQRCCCCGVKNGTTATGWYTLITGAIWLAFFAYLYGAADLINTILESYNGGNFTWGNQTFQVDGEAWEASATIVDHVHTGALIFTIFFGCVVAFSLLLLIGVCNNNKYLLLPWMPCQLVCAGIKVADGVLFGILTAWHAIFIGHFIVLGLFAALDFYCFFCVLSFYQNLTDGITEDVPRVVTVSTTQQQRGYPQPPPYGGGGGHQSYPMKDARY